MQNELQKLKHHPNEFESLTVYGGVNIEDQTRALRRGVDFFVGTCGRVLDHIERGNIDFSALKTVILDEADQMLKQGFKEEVDKVSDFLLITHFKFISDPSNPSSFHNFRSSRHAEDSVVRTCRSFSSLPPSPDG